jgi:hypothetical protein
MSRDGRRRSAARGHLERLERVWLSSTGRRAAVKRSIFEPECAAEE